MIPRLLFGVGAIQWAREQQVPFLGTCAGFQFALIEYSRNVLQARNTAHAETDPTAPDPLIAPPKDDEASFAAIGIAW